VAEYKTAPGQMAPFLQPRSRNPTATREMLIDDPVAVVRKQNRNSLVGDPYEGVMKFPATVLLAFGVDVEDDPLFSLLAPLGSYFSWAVQACDVAKFICQVHPLDDVLGDPTAFMKTDPAEYIKRSLRLYPLREFGGQDSLVETEQTNMLRGLGPGSKVWVTFTDPARTKGHISGIRVGSITDLNSAGVTPSATGAHARGNSRPNGQNPEPGTQSKNPAHLDPDFRVLVDKLIATVKEFGWVFTYMATYRDSVRQDYYRQMEYSTVKKGFHNNVDHETGVPAALAADLLLTNASDNDRKAEAYKVLMSEAKKLGIESGGEWTRSAKAGESPTMYDKSPWKKYKLGWDPAHVQVRGKSNISDVVTSGEFEARSAG